tara:strand:- start:2671 stop:3564 length:894 start_codon:yes stop_codon:yes gene_type:complete
MKRTLFFGNPYHLSTSNRQLEIKNKETGDIRHTPLEDIGYIVFEHPQITFTQSVIQLLAANNAAVVFCDDKYHPCSMLLHLDTNYVQTERFKSQVNATEPLKKQLWQQTIKAKLKNQAGALEYKGVSGSGLRYKSGKVLSGDATNEEAKGARIYWKTLLGSSFRRDRYGAGPNSALNYGYAILRAATARALSGSGLLATLGIHHRNKYNSFCLADDIMEPYRPYVDVLVCDMQNQGFNCADLSVAEKSELLSILTIDIKTNEGNSPLMIALSKTSASLVRCFEKKAKKIFYPKLILQ